MDKGVEIQLEIEKNKVDDAALIAGQGVSGTFVSADMVPQTITVVNGVITQIV